MTGWFEAGEAVKYLPNRTDVGAMIPDYRGGISYAKGFGHLMSSSKGLFFETNEDAVFVSRFQDDMLYYSQNRSGYTLASAGRIRRSSGAALLERQRHRGPAPSILGQLP